MGEVSQLAQGRKVMAARKAKQEGRYRELQVYVGNRITGKVIFIELNLIEQKGTGKAIYYVIK